MISRQLHAAASRSVRGTSTSSRLVVDACATGPRRSGGGGTAGTGTGSRAGRVASRTFARRAS